ncbi:MAG: protein kinase rio1 [Vezdaea aestivalis]|nr:MAG: protein kinase rio1 [Vezdaea aestivalis]
MSQPATQDPPTIQAAPPTTFTLQDDATTITQAARFADASESNSSETSSDTSQPKSQSSDPLAVQSSTNVAAQTTKPALHTHARLDDDEASNLNHLSSRIRLTSLNDGTTGGAPRRKDKADRATVEQVLDPRTRTILLKLVRRGVLERVEGCISTGKEGGVYYGVRGPGDVKVGRPEGSSVEEMVGEGDAVAVKIYKTSILSYKTRAQYVDGSKRFQGGWRRGSNWASVKVWAEKEMRNLRRLETGGVRAPRTVLLKSHVLVMEFVGEEGKAAPRLLDLRSEDDAFWIGVYVQVMGIMRRMFRVCKLVHADLSEYNLLWAGEQVWVIDVGQSVEQDHPKALEFLRVDLRNMTAFFGKRGVKVVSERRAFEYVTKEQGAVETAHMKGEVEALVEKWGGVEEADDEVFRAQFIPQTLEQVVDVQRDAEQVGRGEGDELVYKQLLASSGEEDENESKSEAEGSTADEGDDESRFDRKQPRGKRFEDKDSKKEHKKHVKEEKREGRQKKMPKHVKKQLISSSSRQKH